MRSFLLGLLSVTIVFLVGVAAGQTIMGRVDAAPNCRQYLDKAVQYAEDSEKWAFERRASSAKLSLAYSRIAEVCAKF